MTPETAIAKVPLVLDAPRPAVTSFDSGYEHSLQHLAEVRSLVEEADQDEVPVTEWLMANA
jgi:hypothetical protein